MSYKIQETYVNSTKGYRYHDSEITETHIESLGKLFKACQKEFGRCEGKIYVDTPSGAQQRGWVFARMSRYEDARLKDKDAWYCQEVWVTVFADSDEKIFQN